jgi:spoIIIJ-associated protein
VYDAMQEAHEFIGRDRAEALAKAIAFFGVGEEELAIADVDATKASGLGTRFALVAYRRSAGPPGRHGGGEARGGEGRRGREAGGRDREPREGRRDRGERGRDRDHGDRGRGDRDRGDRGRGRREGGFAAREPRHAEEPRHEEVPVSGPSSGTATTALSAIGTFVQGLIERMDLGSFEITESGESEGLIVLQLGGAAATRLASGDGRAVDAVQLLANQASLCAGGDDAKRVVVEVEGNADERATLLERIAERAAQRARETGRPVALEAMSPRDRRTVHMALREAAGIATMSVGDGRYRQVVVVPDSAPEYEEAKRYESQSQRDYRD